MVSLSVHQHMMLTLRTGSPETLDLQTMRCLGPRKLMLSLATDTRLPLDFSRRGQFREHWQSKPCDALCFSFSRRIDLP